MYCHAVTFFAAVWLARSQPHCRHASVRRKPLALAGLQASGLFVDPIWLAYKDRNQPHKHSDQANREKVGLQDKSKNYPYELSGGEQQRLVIARAIVNNPKLIIADEPTGNLDPEVAENILKLLLLCDNACIKNLE